MFLFRLEKLCATARLLNLDDNVSDIFIYNIVNTAYQCALLLIAISKGFSYQDHFVNKEC